MRYGSEFRWILEGFTPETIPMSRLAEYMQQLARLLGEEPSVHFVRIERGSVALVANADLGASGKVASRIGAVRRGSAPRDAMAAHSAINSMLETDRAAASLKQGGAIVLRFRGAKSSTPAAAEIEDHGSLVGDLYQLAKSRNGYQARLQVKGGAVFCAATEQAAMDMRNLLFERVRVHGKGLWRRGDDSAWSPTDFTILGAKKVERAKLRGAVDSLRALPIGWQDDPLQYITDIDDEGGRLQ